MVIDPQAHTHNTSTNPQTGPITIHCAAKLSVQCNHVSVRVMGVVSNESHVAQVTVTHSSRYAYRNGTDK